MSIAFVNTSNGASWNPTPITTIATSAFNCVAGNFLVVVQNNIAAGSTITDTAGNTYIQVRTSDPVMTFWYCPNCKGNTSNVITATFPSSTFIYLAVLQYSGLDQNRPIDTWANTPYGSHAQQNPFTPNISTRWAKEVLIGWVISGDGTGGTGTGYTLRATPGSPAQILEDNIVSTLQTNVNATATEGTLQSWGMTIIALVGAGQRPAGSSTLLGVG